LLRRDGSIRAWYQRIKRRRGSKVARVAVMRRTATILWRMLTTGEPWRSGRAGSEMPEAGEPRQTPVSPDGADEELAQSAAPARAGLSTGSSSCMFKSSCIPMDLGAS
jgi:hypothetical protein